MDTDETQKIVGFCENSDKYNYLVGIGCLPAAIGLVVLVSAGILRLFVYFPYFSGLAVAGIIVGTGITVGILIIRDLPHGSDKIVGGIFLGLLVGAIYLQSAGTPEKPTPSIPDIPISHDRSISLGSPEVVVSFNRDGATEIKIFMPEIESLDYYFSYDVAYIVSDMVNIFESVPKSPDWGETIRDPAMRSFSPWFTVSVPLNDSHRNRFVDINAAMNVTFPVSSSAIAFEEKTQTLSRTFRLYIVSPEDMDGLEDSGFSALFRGPVTILAAVSGLLLLIWGLVAAYRNQWRGIWCPKLYRVQKGFQLFDTIDMNRYLSLYLPLGAYVWITNATDISNEEWKPSNFSFECHDVIVTCNGQLLENGRAFGSYLQKAFLEGLELRIEVSRNKQLYEVVWIDENQARKIKEKRVKNSGQKTLE